jgi:hypothetical protein
MGDLVVYAHDIASARIITHKGEHSLLVDCIQSGDRETASSLRLHSVPCQSYEQAQTLLGQLKGVMESVDLFVLGEMEDDDDGR